MQTNQRPNQLVLQQLRAAIREKDALPALGLAVAKIVEMTQNPDEAVQRLVDYILADIGLTQKVLRMANNTQRNASPITTVSKAVMVLGFETVRSCALGMLLIEKMASPAQTMNLVSHFGKSLCASAVARQLIRIAPYPDAEEIVIAALFSNLGQTLVAVYDFALFDQVLALSKAQNLPLTQASAQLIGWSFERLGLETLQDWKMTERVVHALAFAPIGEIKPATSRGEWMANAVAFSQELARAVFSEPPETAAKALEVVNKRFSTAFGVDQAMFERMVQFSKDESLPIVKQLIDLQQHAQANDATVSVDDVLNKNQLAGNAHKEDPQQTQATQRIRPENAQALLLEGLMKVMDLTAQPRYRINDVIMVVLDTIAKALAYRFVTICLPDVMRHRYQARLCVGQIPMEKMTNLHFSATLEKDLFGQALSQGADVVIDDTFSMDIRKLLPLWHQQLFPDARSILILPLVINEKLVGCIYADRIVADSDPMNEDEVESLLELKSALQDGLMNQGS